MKAIRQINLISKNTQNWMEKGWVFHRKYKYPQNSGELPKTKQNAIYCDVFI